MASTLTPHAVRPTTLAPPALTPLAGGLLDLARGLRCSAALLAPQVKPQPPRVHVQEPQASAASARAPRGDSSVPLRSLALATLCAGLSRCWRRRRATKALRAADVRCEWVEVEGASAAVGGATIRVVTYNVLSPTLCSLNRFPHCSKENLDEKKRWSRIKAQLEGVVAASGPTVICLQEVSEEWSGKLHAFFQKKGWHFTFALTPSTFFPPIGVGMAWANADLELEELLINRLGSSCRPPFHKKPSFLMQQAKALLRFVSFHRLGRTPVALKPWVIAGQKQNRLLAARLRDRRSGRLFVVATYHMPCLFGAPPDRKAKALHAAALRKAVAKFAAGGDIVLAGDLNTKPPDSELGILLSGEIDSTDVACPQPYEGLDWNTLLTGQPAPPLRSAYKDALGEEPAFTNYAWIEKEPEPFMDTIDYLLVSPGVRVLAVKRLPSLEPGAPVYPTAHEPSDHVLLAADLCLGGA